MAFNALSQFLPRGLIHQSSAVFTEDVTLNFDFDLMALVVLVGAGGSGALAIDGDNNAKLGAGGGNGGGVAIQLLRMKANTDYIFTIAPQTTGPDQGSPIPTSPQAIAGINGADTTLQIGGTGSPLYTIRAKGGLGGKAFAQLSTFTGASPAATFFPDEDTSWGENADTIFTGGLGGVIGVAAGTSGATRACASGGGAANILGLPYTSVLGGNALITNSSSDHHTCAAGGAGVGGGGGDAVSTGSSTTNGTRYAGGGGGSGGPGVDISESTQTDITSAGGPAFPITHNALIAPDGAGGAGEIDTTSTGNDGGAGAGGGGKIETSTSAESSVARGGNGGIFGGGGGCSLHRIGGSGGRQARGGSGGYGGGGGGCATAAHYTDRSQFGQGGHGGQGVAFLYYLTDHGKVLV